MILFHFLWCELHRSISIKVRRECVGCSSHSVRVRLALSCMHSEEHYATKPTKDHYVKYIVNCLVINYYYYFHDFYHYLVSLLLLLVVVLMLIIINILHPYYLLRSL